MGYGRVGLAAILTVATIAVGARAVGAEPGDVDSTFGTCGVKTWSSPDGFFGFGATTAIQPDGKMLRIGSSYDGTISVTRLVASGAGIDRTYGTDGTARIHVPGVQFVTGAAVATNGKLVLAAERQDSSSGPGLILTAEQQAASPPGLVLARITASGRLDSTFGSGGVLTADASGVSGVLVQSDNRIIVWGSWPLPYLRRYLANGTLDSAWAPQLPAGVSVVNLGTLAANGDLIVGSGLGVNSTFYRYKPDGTLDGTFAAAFVFPGTNPATSSGFTPTKILELPGGKFLVVGTLAISSPNLGSRNFIGAVQLTSTGPVDTSFGTAGFIATQTNGYPVAPIVGLDQQGRLIVVRGEGEGGYPFGYLTLTRYSTAGVPDSSFGVEGSATAEVDGYAIATGISIRGNWIIVGVLTFTYPENNATVRFRTDDTKLGAGYLVDPDGDLHPFRFGTDPPPPCIESPNLQGQARGVATITNRGGLILDGFGGLHPFSAGARKAPAPAVDGPYWPGFDIARGVTALRNGKGGYVLDGYGGIHGYRTRSSPMPAAAKGGPYWSGWDIARGIALLPNGTGGYVLDGFGTLHPFRVGANPKPPAATISMFLPGVDIARGVAILPDGTGGYVADAFGNVHPFGIGSHAAPPLPGPTSPTGHTPNARGVTFVAPRIGP
jgi:uncharacterized delta-60 repeat protein